MHVQDDTVSFFVIGDWGGMPSAPTIKKLNVIYVYTDGNLTTWKMNFIFTIHTRKTY